MKIFERARKNKKAQSVKLIVMLVVGMILIGMLLYLGYKYILGTGEDIGGMSGCEAQEGGNCVSDDKCPAGQKKFLLGGCEDNEICCISTTG